MSRRIGPYAALAVALIACIVANSALAKGKKKKKNQQQDVPVVCHDVALHGSTALLAQTAGVSLWDLSDPLRPRSTFRLRLPATILGIDLRSPWVYLAAGTHGMYIARLQEEAAPELISRHDTPGSVGSLVTTGHYAVLGDDRYGIRVIDVSDPVRPLQKAQISTRDRVRSLALRDHLLAIAEGSAGVRVIDVEHPERPRVVHLLRDVRNARDVAFVGDWLLVAAGTDGLLVYGFDLKGDLKRIGAVKIEDTASFVGGDLSLAVVSNGTPSLQLVRLDDDGRPTMFGELRVHRSAPAGRIHVRGQMVYTALDRAGISIVDMADPLAPDILLPRERQLKIEWPAANADR